MSLGPIEVIVTAFETDLFQGDIIPELERLVDHGVVSIVDGVFVQRVSTTETAIVEFEQGDTNADVARVASLIEEASGLISGEDVDELTEHLPVGASAAVLVFEHTWVEPLRDRIIAVGGELIESIRVPGPVVDSVLDEIAALDKKGE